MNGEICGFIWIGINQYKFIANNRKQSSILRNKNPVEYRISDVQRIFISDCVVFDISYERYIKNNSIAGF